MDMIRFNSDKKRIFLEFSNKTRKVESNRLLAMVYIQIFFGGFDSESFESFFGGILAHNVKGYIILRIFFLSILLNRLNNYFLNI